MERESFEDVEVARLLNKDFIAIKVDREERPDIDSIYMTVCQALTGQGGWPMTIIMTPDARPFFAGTYFPRHDRMGLPGIVTVLERASRAWRENRGDLLEAGQKITETILKPDETVLTPDVPTEPAGGSAAAGAGAAAMAADDTKLIHEAFEQYRRSFDSMHGGFGNAPKFPSLHILFFLLRYWKLYKNETALKMVEKTLESMRRGGIFDHIGFGFCRYSTDRLWLVPHFEKMLYDNALLAIACLEAYQAAGNGSFAQTAEEIFTYILRDIASPDGGFYSAEDADSEGKEGLFYTWTPEEIEEVLGKNDAGRFMVLFDITSKGNFDGRNIPNTVNGSIPGSDLEFVEVCRKKLFERREKRTHPFKDDKILVSWNGLMIAAMAMGGRVLGNPKYTDAAEKSAEFIFNRLVSRDGRLLAVYRGGPSPLKGYADDYAFMIWGLLELYETSYKADYLQRALNLNDSMLDLFWDHKKGGFFLYGNDSEQLIARPKEAYDGAMPSANSAAANNLIRLARLTGRHELEDKAYQLIKAFSGNMENYPAGFTYMLCAAILLEAGGTEIIISGEADKGAREFQKILSEGFRPFTVSMYYNQDSAQESEKLGNLIPYIKNYSTVGGKAAAYVCRNFTCKRPATDATAFAEMLKD